MWSTQHNKTKYSIAKNLGSKKGASGREHTLQFSRLHQLPVVLGHSLASNSYRMSRSTLIDLAWILNI